MKRVEVTWVDASLVNMWTTLDSLSEMVIPECNHLGYLQYVDDEKIILSFGKSELDLIHAPFAIPIGCIKRIVDKDTNELLALEKLKEVKDES